MNWRKLLGLETRSSAPYTDAIVQALQERATGVAPDSSAIGSLEIASGLWARGLGSATVVSPDNSVTSVLSPSVLASMGRGLVRRGEALFVLDVRDDALRMLEASSWDVSGGHDPTTWIYRVDLPGPSATASRRYLAASVVHIRFAVDPASPWRGVSPLEWATATGKLGANLETRLGEESGGPVGYLLPVPQDGGDDNLGELRKDLASLGGGISLVETTAGGWSEGRGSAPRSDWKAERLGARFPESSVSLWSDVGRVVLAACGVPPALADPSADGTAQRESWRRFLHGSLQPVSRIIEEECSSKLDTEISLSFRSLMASDLAGRARAFGSLTTNEDKLTAAQAGRVCGFDLEQG